MNSIQFAAHQTAHGDKRGDLARMAEYLGIGEQQLRNKVNPDQEARLSLDDAVRMMRKDCDLRILFAMCAEFGGSFQKAGCIVTNVLNAMLATNAEDGDLTRTVQEIMADDVVTQAELAAAELRIEKVRNALAELEQALIVKSAEQRNGPRVVK